MALAGKEVIVTGVASGIGLATANHLRDLGARVIGVDIAPSASVDEHHIADLSDPSAIDDVIAAIPPGAHGLCNIAGVPPSAPPGVVLALNAKGLERLTVGLAPGLAIGGAIVNVASSAGSGWESRIDALRAFDDVAFDMPSLDRFAIDQDLTTGGSSYFFSKEFVITWTMRNRWTWRDRDIRVNSVSPGPVDTPALPEFVSTLTRAPRLMELMDRPGQPDEIASVIAFLLSDDSGWIRGTNIAVDGGLTSHLALERHGFHR